MPTPRRTDRFTAPYRFQMSPQMSPTRRPFRPFLPFEDRRRGAIIQRGRLNTSSSFFGGHVMHAPHVLSGGRYPVLRSLAIIYVIGAGLAAISTVIGVLYALFGTDFAWTDRLIITLGALTAGFFLVLTMLAIAEVLKLFIDVEHNTRAAATGAGAAGTTVTATPDMVVV